MAKIPIMLCRQTNKEIWSIISSVVPMRKNNSRPGALKAMAIETTSQSMTSNDENHGFERGAKVLEAAAAELQL